MSDMPKCPNCGRWSPGDKPCEWVSCLACGTFQCFGNGSARGTCRTCYHGMIPGWSGNNNPADHPGRYRPAMPSESVRCDYKGCNAMAVYRHLPGSKSRACLAHGTAVLARQAERRAETARKRGRI
jgi:hypothetical protein